MIGNAGSALQQIGRAVERTADDQGGDDSPMAAMAARGVPP